MKSIATVVGVLAVVSSVGAGVVLAAGPAAPAKPATPPTLPSQMPAAGPATPVPPGQSAAPSSEADVVVALKDVKWGPGAPSLPPGAQMAVMAGDPAVKGFVSLRAKVPAGYKVPPHFHPTDEHVTVLAGEMAFGMGDTVDAKTEKTVNQGGYFIARANMHHYAIAKKATVIQIDLEGPFAITYINPADDPTKKAP